MDLYKRFILPRFLNSVMGSAELEGFRPKVVSLAKGVVLEIGMGPGHNLPFYRNILKLYALEPSKELTIMAQKRAEEVNFPVEFLHASAEQIPLPDQSVDTVLSTWTLCSVASPQKTLSEIARVLKPGGKFIFIEHGLSPSLFVRAIQKTLTPFTKYFTGNCHMNRNIKELIRDAGFMIAINKEFSQRLYRPLIYNTEGSAVKNSSV